MQTIQRDGLSAVMIGCNEEKFLPLTLPPLREAVDEVIFVDTGSQDRTLDIAEEFGCRIFRHDWVNDFSAPKNFGIDQASHSWILNVDCDEALTVDNGTRGWIHNQCHGGNDKPVFIVGIDNLLANGAVTRQESMRLFRNDPRIRFENPIHESVCESVYRNWPHYRPERVDLRLTHYGYQQDANKEKMRRNIKILREWLSRESDNIFGNYKLGMNLHHQGNISEGLYFMGRAFDLVNAVADKRSYPFLEQMVPFYFQGLLEEGRREEAMDVKASVARWR
ncbi:MAG: glycosyltransferase [Magnetococcales bacterium]|nr:glycosyltransferase [Magnetococcales bacterium]